MSDPTGFVELADELDSLRAENERLSGELDNAKEDAEYDAGPACVSQDDHARLPQLKAAVVELLAALDDRLDAKRLPPYVTHAHQYRVEQAFRVVRELVGVA